MGPPSRAEEPSFESSKNPTASPANETLLTIKIKETATKINKSIRSDTVIINSRSIRRPFTIASPLLHCYSTITASSLHHHFSITAPSPHHYL
ncbi:MAG: hypothetical protein ACK5ND_00620 [Bacteroides sp.]